jgi:hypothetical protein
MLYTVCISYTGSVVYTHAICLPQCTILHGISVQHQTRLFDIVAALLAVDFLLDVRLTSDLSTLRL